MALIQRGISGVVFGCPVYLTLAMLAIAVALNPYEATAPFLARPTCAKQPTATTPSKLSKIDVGPSLPLPVEGAPQQLWASAAPDDPDRLLVCAFEADSSHGRLVSAAYVSLDGGNTWMRSLFDANSDWVSETSCAAGTRGRAYFVAGVSDTSNGPMSHVSGSAEVYRSSDGGLSWTKPRRYPFIDWMTLAVSPGVDEERVFLFGNVEAVGADETGTGEWMKKSRPMLTSTDGLAFSPPIFPQDPRPEEKEGYPVSAVVFDDGSAAALFAEIGKTGFALYRYDGEVYRLASHVEMPPGVTAYGPLSARMALGRAGRFRGRLYAAIPGIEGKRPVLVLATSDDRGYSWHAHPFLYRNEKLREDQIEYFYAGVAVNTDGIVGIEWSSDLACPVFAISTDGGESVAHSQQLGKCKSSEFPPSVAAYLKTYDDRSWVEHPLVYSPDAHPGFTLHVSPAALASVQITADAAGHFHAFWSEPQADGMAVLTAVLRVRPSSPEPVTVREGEELTERSTIKVDRENLDPYQGRVSVDLSIRSISSASMPYPYILAVSGDRSDCGSILYLNPYGTSERGERVFRVPARPDRHHLFPGEGSLPVHIEVRIEGCEAGNVSLAVRSRKLALQNKSLFPLAVRFRVYAAPGRLESDGDASCHSGGSLTSRSRCEDRSANPLRQP